MKYEILIENEKVWNKDFEKIAEFLHENIKIQIQKSSKIPWQKNLDIKKLKKYKTSDFRFRIGNYRVLFDEFDNVSNITSFKTLLIHH